MKPALTKSRNSSSVKNPQRDWRPDMHPDVGRNLIAEGIRLLHPIQLEALQEGALDGKSLLVCSPSGSGKTLIGELVCVHQALAGKKAFLLVPLRALASERYLHFQRRYRTLGIQIGISTGDYSTDPSELAKMDITILTYERFDWLLRMEPEWLDQLGVLVIDEVHNIGERLRGPRLECSFTRFRQRLPDVQIIGLSATIANPDELASWLGCQLVHSNERPVELRYRVVLAPKPLQSVARLVRASIRKEGQVLVFTPSRQDAERISLALIDIVRPLLSAKEQEALAECHQLLRLDEESPPIRERLATRLQFGVAFHHAGLDVISRRNIEDLFQKRLLKVICCTTTLGAGINTPARLVILIHPHFSPGEAIRIHELQYLNSNRVHQILGRAGRPGHERVGFAVLLAETPEESKKFRDLYFQIQNGKSKPLYNRVTSQLFSVDMLREQVLVLAAQNQGISTEDIEQFFEKTFWWHQQQDSNPKSRIKQLISIGCLDVDALISTQQEAEKRAEDAEPLPQPSQATSVDLTLLTYDRIEGRIQDGGWFTCAFTDSGPICSCRQHHHDQVLCSHLLALARFAILQHPQYAREIIPRSLKEEFILDFLERSGLIVLRDQRYYTMALGRLTVKLYLKPDTALWIKSRLPAITTTPSFIASVVRGLQFESDFSKTVGLSQSLGLLVEKTDTSLIKAARKGKIEIGDLETLLQTVIWLARSIIAIAQMLGYDEVVIIGEPVVAAWERHVS